jgi:hypothetical protein
VKNNFADSKTCRSFASLTKSKKDMKLTKIETIEKIESGAVLVKKFERMYGTYFFMNCPDGTTIWNLNESHCKSIIASGAFKKTMVDSNMFEFSK